VPMLTRIAAAIIAGCALIGQAHADSPLQDQMQRVIELERLDAWCAGTHDIDFDRLRAAIAHVMTVEDAQQVPVARAYLENLLASPLLRA
jgi:hypothetical protein